MGIKLQTSICGSQFSQESNYYSVLCRALVHAIGETLWLAGGKRKAVVAVLDIPEIYAENGGSEEEQDEVLIQACV